jgi:hypothetical protein
MNMNKLIFSIDFHQMYLFDDWFKGVVVNNDFVKLHIELILKLFITLFALSIHLILMAKECTWERKGFKHIKVINMKYKHWMTICVSLVANGTLLPMQIISINKTKW